ncbi:MAG: sulfatase-like hydrolase/transferase [Minicystis sp.]
MRPEPLNQEGETPALGAAGGVLFGFAALGMVNAVMIVVKVPLPHNLSVRVYHHVYDAGQMLALGLGASAVVELWSRWGPRRPVWGYLATALAAGLAAIPLLSADLTGAVTTLTPGGNPTLWLGLFLTASGIAVMMVALIGRLLARRYLRWLGVLLGLAAGVANHLLLENDYPGVHFYLTWVAALLIGASLHGAALPGFLARRAPGWLRRVLPPYSPRLLWPLRAALCLIAGAALAVQPTNAVALELLRLPGTVVAPQLATLRVSDFPPLSPDTGDEWLSAHRPDRPASQPSILGADPIVLLVIIDAMRADLVGSGKYTNELPALEALRRESVDFSNARSPTTGTIWTLSTLFSDRYYSQLHWSVKPFGASAKVYPHEDESIRFPEILSRGGVTTATYTEMPDATNAYGVVRGFGEERVFRGKAGYADKVTDALIERLGHQKEGPLFLYVHFLEPHSPYDRGGTQGKAFDRYLREVRVVDGQLGKLRRYLAGSGLDARTSLIVTADHGEAFGEHHTEYHGVSVYEELLRVPLLMKVPGIAPARVERDVSLIDLAPTFLDLFGQTTPGAFMGQSLVPYLRSEDPVLTRPLVFDTGRWQQAMIFPDHLKVIRDRRKGTFELYDLLRDPQELENLFDASSEGDARADRLSAFFYVHTLRKPGYRVPFRP